MTGRPPKAARLKILSGNPGKRPVNSPPRPAGADPAPPDWLQGEARAEWGRVASELHKLGLLTVLDVSVLAVYCICYQTWAEAVRAVAREGQTYRAPGG